MKIRDFRKLIYGVDYEVPLENGEKIQAVNFDNAATTPALVTVISDVIKFLIIYSSSHRGFGFKSEASTKLYDECRKIVAKFVGADIKKNTVIFVKNATEAINKLSNILYTNHKDAVILSTDMEHHSNDLPWRKFKIDYINIDEFGVLSLEDMERKLQYYNGAVKLVTVTGASNVTGYKNPIYKIASIVHKYGAMIMVDGAQLVPHAHVNMSGKSKNDYLDFLVFSGHKMYAPFGCGVLIGPKDIFQGVAPDYPGGGNVEIVTHNYIKWDKSPLKDEPGSPNAVGAAAMASAMNALSEIGMKNIEEYEKKLTKYAVNKMKQLPHIKFFCKGSKIYGKDSGEKCDGVSIITFNIEGLSHETVAKYLSYKGGISVRDGCFCAHPYVQRLLKMTDEEVKERIRTNSHKPGMVRISFGFYNTFEEINRFIYHLEKLIKNREKYYQ
ncbi:aminotransferase class V-fold PLP-dependent enzyme [Clostridium sediminicola]|uniref:aminotransferase class V-fold PLP-dependent enzyme n=1 Tax=Clostridium sediminicola TaxID=3114879 RepID=UPI0031F23CE1